MAPVRFRYPAPRLDFPIFDLRIGGGPRGPPHWFPPDKSSPLGAVSRASRLAKTRFEPNTCSAATFFRKRLLSLAVFSREEATFIHSAIGSSQPFCFCSRFVICSSSDFFSERYFAFSLRDISRSI